MVWTKWYTAKLLLDKMVWTKRYRQNGTNQMVAIFGIDYNSSEYLLQYLFSKQKSEIKHKEELQHVKQPTHTRGGKLDHVFTRCEDTVMDLRVDSAGMISDHSLITWKLKFIFKPPI